MVAAKKKDLESFTKVVSNGGDINATTNSRLTVLHFAAVNEIYGLDIIASLAEPKLTAKDVDGEEPIHYAVRAKNFKIAQYLLDRIDPSSKNLLHFFVLRNELNFAKLIHSEFGNKCFDVCRRKGILHIAAEHSGWKMCKWLVEKGNDINAKSKGRKITVLHYAVKNKNAINSMANVDFFVSLNRRLLNEKDVFGETPLHWALKVEDIPLAEKLLDMDTYIFVKNREKMNLLLFCVSKNKLKSAKLVHSKNKTMIRGVCTHNWTALHIAALKKNYQMCKWLIKNGVDTSAVESKDNRFFLEFRVLKESRGNPLMVAAKKKDLASFTNVVSNGGDVYATTNSGLTVLHFAAVNEIYGLNIIASLAEPKLTAKDVDGEEPIHYAVRAKNFKIAQYLLDRIDPSSKNLLHFFVLRNELNFAKLIHSEFGNKCFDVCRRKGILHIAAEHSGWKMCKWLVEKGNDINAKSIGRKITVLHYAVKNKNAINSMANVDFFVSLNRRLLNEKDVFGETPLHWALKFEDIPLAKKLLDMGTNIFVRNREKMNLLFFCVSKNKLKSAKLVHSKNKTMIRGVWTDGWTALHIAALKNNYQICKWLIKNGVDTSAVESRNNRSALKMFKMHMHNFSKEDIDGEEPIHYAVRVKNYDFANSVLNMRDPIAFNLLHFFIMENDLKFAKVVNDEDGGIFIENIKGKTLLHYAAQFAGREMCEWLVEKGLDVAAKTRRKYSVLNFALLNDKMSWAMENADFFITKNPSLLNYRNVFDQTPLHRALYRQDIPLATFLLEKGASISIKWTRNKNLLHFCVQKRKFESAKFVHGMNNQLIKEVCDGGITALHIASITSPKKERSTPQALLSLNNPSHPASLVRVSSYEF
ncbi:putative ankyrin repeat protein RF_0381 [Cloeon dipterum]|uniref:putative ankyrin repeat protein RF_0381 n=1 Tax=Cloeon dipterum TaxID=197152 RepID=UPI0032204B89